MKFINGLRIRKQDFKDGGCIFKLNIKFDTFIDCIGDLLNQDGYINVDCKKAKDSDNWYAVLNEWKPNANNNIQ